MTSRSVRELQEAGEALAKLINAAPAVVDAALSTLASGELPSQNVSQEEGAQACTRTCMWMDYV